MSATDGSLDPEAHLDVAFKENLAKLIEGDMARYRERKAADIAKSIDEERGKATP